MKTDSVLDFSYKYSINKIMHPCLHIFDFYSNKNKNKIGTLVCHISELPLRPNYDKSVLAVDFLEVTDKNKGIGTKILTFAEKYSKQKGCKGFLTVKADGSFTPEKIPHLFYRKYGFSTLDIKTDAELDYFIRQNTNATNKDFPNLIMHYPPEVNKKSSLKERLFLFFKKFFR